MKNTNIEWCDHTVNFWWGCTKVSPACAACYALAMAKIFSRGRATWGPEGARWLRENRALDELLKLDASAEKRGVRERVFINSMSDTFEDRDDLNQARTALWLAVYGVSNLDIILLTKRPENVMKMVPAHWATDWPVHVWIGTTVENQEMADMRVPVLISIPAKVRFLSCEPLLGPVDLERPRPGPDLDQGDRKICQPWLIQSGIHWVICGGESGPQARPMHPDWARSLRDQCQAAGVPFMFKQYGEWVGGKFDARKGKVILDDGVIFWTNPGHPKIHYWPAGDAPEWKLPISARVGKKAHRLTLAGKELASNNRLLDGVEHNGFPEVRHA